MSTQCWLCTALTLTASTLALGASAQGLSEEAAATKARQIEARMTDDERFSMLLNLASNVYNAGVGKREPRLPADVPRIAGYTAGVPRLGVPALKMSDASLGMRDTGGPTDFGTGLPAGLALGSTFNPKMAYESGAIVGRELRARGLNVALGAGINLVREVRNGRNFEYISEDPWLSALMGAEIINGTQAQGVMPSIKHVSLHAQETNKLVLDAVIDPAAHRESDLLAFEIALDRSKPGAIMCAYNKINGAYACGNDPILNGIVKQAWRFPGWIMSDWKAVHGWEFALAGLDQQSGPQLDEKEWFNQPLREAYAAGRFPKERLSDMVRRILHSIYASGIDQWPAGPAPAFDQATHHATAVEVARQGIVLLKNDGVLPLAANARRIAVIGGHANAGVVSGDGSSQVKPYGGYVDEIRMRDHPVIGPSWMRLFPTAPWAELRKAVPEGTVVLFDPGAHATESATFARDADLAIVFAVRHETERYDSPDMSLPFGQNALIEAVAAANPNTIVVLQTGNPIAMPWRRSVKAIVQAWFPGEGGAQAIAEVLTGKVNPSGRLPITFPADVAQTPFPTLTGSEVLWSPATPNGNPTTVHYGEGAEVGYRWFAKNNTQPLFPFGHGLSYTSFDYSGLEVSGGDTVTATFVVHNVGKRAGADVPQVYLTDAAGKKRLRLLGFERVELKPGESRAVTVTADPRLLATYDLRAGQWRIVEGPYTVALARSATDFDSQAKVRLAGRLFGH